MKDQVWGIVTSLFIHSAILLVFLYITAYARSNSEPVVVDFSVTCSLIGNGSGIGGPGGGGISGSGPAVNEAQVTGPGFAESMMASSQDRSANKSNPVGQNTMELKTVSSQIEKNTRSEPETAASTQRKQEATTEIEEKAVEEQKAGVAFETETKIDETPEPEGVEEEPVSEMIEEESIREEMVEKLDDLENEPLEPQIADKQVKEEPVIENFKESTDPQSSTQQMVKQTALSNSPYSQSSGGVSGGGIGKNGNGMPGGPGTGGGTVDQYYLQQHFKYVSRRIRQSLEYPEIAIQMGWSGKVNVSFLISKNGDISDLKVVKSSGFPVLDKYAIKAIRRIGSLSEPPATVKVVLPINFKVDTKVVETEISALQSL